MLKRIPLLLTPGIFMLVIGLAAPSVSLTQAAPPQQPPEPVLGDIDLEAIAAIDLTEFPLVPEIGEYALGVYQTGLEQGKNPNAFVKVGDCMTDNPYFLIPIGEDNYDLGEYTDLQRTIDHFTANELDPFARKSQAALGGFNTTSILDSMWTNPEFCEAGETPLGCEFRLMEPSIALIMFGTNDIQFLPEDIFDYSLRSIVVATINNGTLPILSTFPHRPEFPEKSVLYNQIVAQIALDYDVPLINLWLALEELPNQGVDPVETTHMTTPEDSGAVCYFLGPNLEAGFTVRNLLTLQTLDQVLQATEAE